MTCVEIIAFAFVTAFAAAGIYNLFNCHEK